MFKQPASPFQSCIRTTPLQHRCDASIRRIGGTSLLALCVLALLTALSTPTHADTLLIDAIEHAPPDTPQGLLRPHNAQTMKQVEQQFGKPDNTYGPVGKPPISRWHYPKFTVYFEHNLVITSVVNHISK